MSEPNPDPTRAAAADRANRSVPMSVQCAIRRLQRLFFVHEHMLARVRGIPILERAAIVFHGEGTVEEYRLLQVHSLPHSTMLLRHAHAFVRAIARTRQRLTSVLPRLSLLRPHPRTSSVFPGASAATAAWLAAEIFAREIEETRRREQGAEVGVVTVDEPLRGWHNLQESWEYRVRSNQILKQLHGSQLGGTEAVLSSATQQHAELAKEIAAAPICWPDLAQLLARRGRQFPSEAFIHMREELVFEQAMINEAAHPQPPAPPRLPQPLTQEPTTKALTVSPAGATTRQRPKKAHPRPPVPKGWLYLSDASTKFGVPPSTLHRFASRLPDRARRKDEVSKQVLVEEAALTQLLQNAGRLSP